MTFFLPYIIIVSCITAMAILNIIKDKKSSDPSPIVEKNHRWHSPKGEYTENHVDRIDNKKIKHPEPEPGYVVLNGVKRKIEDCRNL